MCKFVELTYDFFRSRISTKYSSHNTFVLGKLYKICFQVIEGSKQIPCQLNQNFASRKQFSFVSLRWFFFVSTHPFGAFMFTMLQMLFAKLNPLK